MALKKAAKSPAMRLDMGAAILAAAQTNNTHSVKRRLDTFTAVHRRYASAQRQVQSIDEQTQAAQNRLAATDTAQDGAVEALARALVTDGQPRSNPFTAFGAVSPCAVKRLWAGDEAKAIHQLVAVVRGHPGASQATLAAAAAADKSARAVEAVVAQLGQLEQASRRARQRRDGINDTWDTALAALKRGARAAVDDGAPGLYAALFGRVTRPTRKKPQPAPPSPAPPVTVTPEPVVSPAATGA
jgi:hypothetical protein